MSDRPDENINKIKLLNKYNNNFEFDFIEARVCSDKIIIKCRKCNFTFYRRLGNAINSCKCKECDREYRKNDFIKRAKIKHKEKYEYDLSNFVNGKTKIKIYCKECKIYFYQTAESHLFGRGCKSCQYKKVKALSRNEYTTEKFISKSKQVHKDLYNYSKVNYNGNRTHVILKCNRCNKEFKMKPIHHLRGQGCKECNRLEEWIKRKKFKSKEEVQQYLDNNKLGFIFLSDMYKTKFDKYIFKCKKCGGEYETFIQSLNKGGSCSRCGISLGEGKIKNYLHNKNINFKQQVTFDDCKHIYKLKFDFGVYDDCENLLFLIEYDGKQHFEEIKSFFNRDSIELIQKRDRIKDDYCTSKNIPLLRISYKETDTNIKNLIDNYLDLYKRL